MARWTWRLVLGGSVAAVLLIAATPAPRAETAAQPAAAARKAAPVATRPAKLVAKTAAKKTAPVRPAKKLADAKHKAPAKKPEKKIAAAKKSPSTKPVKTAAVAPQPVPKPAVPSYTITSTHDGVTTIATRIVPLPATPSPAAGPVTVAAAPPVEERPAPAAEIAVVKPTAKPGAAASDVKLAATPVSLTEPAASAKPAPFAAMAATAIAPLPEKQPSPAIEPAHPSDPKAAAAFVSSFLREAFRLAKLHGATSLQRRAELADLFASNMDVKRIAGYTTADELSGLSPDVQQRFRTILVSYLVETYYPQLELASDPSVTVETTAAEPLADGTAVVWTVFTKDSWGSQSVKWYLEPEAGSYKVIDIYSAGASLVQMERDTFQSVMRNGGLSELMAKLDARTKELATAATE